MTGLFPADRITAPPQFLDVSPAGRFKGIDGTEPVADLRDRWVSESRVMYIGKANVGRSGRRGLRRRLDEYRRYKLVNFEDREVQPARANAKGKVTASEKMRGGLSRIFFEDRVAPVTPAELEAAHGHHGEEPVSVGAGLLLGTKAYRDDKEAKVLERRAKAKVAVRACWW